MTATVFRNARVVLADQVVHGSVATRDGLIASIDSGPGEVGLDMQGDFLLPGLVEIIPTILNAT
jgi:alpha-D-ribose 1-methylphosphonate 5-triphosphate diphosphatase